MRIKVWLEHYCNRKHSSQVLYKVQCVCVRSVCVYSVGIPLVLICNTVAPSPFPDKWCYLAESDASITVMNDTVHINIATPLLLYSATLLSWQERWAGGIISLPHLSLSHCPLNLLLSPQTQVLNPQFSFCIQTVRSNHNNQSRANFNKPRWAKDIWGPNQHLPSIMSWEMCSTS